MEEKISWEGTVLSVQPRIRLMRSFDEQAHTYLGYALKVHEAISNGDREYLVGIGKAAQQKYQFQVGDRVSGQSYPVADPRTETVAYYKTSALKVIERAASDSSAPPPWHGVPPDLPTYRQRGHRRLDARTFETKCSTCIWGCRMPVEIVVDHWNPEKKKHRFETFCYGPRSCLLHKAGSKRRVPGRKGMTYVEEDWVDQDATSHRGEHE